MYYVDTGTSRIDVFDFDANTGMISDRRPLVVVAERDGRPDGIIVDAEGCLWLALWGGSAFTATRRTDASIAPWRCRCRTRPCAFGGDDLSRTLHHERPPPAVSRGAGERTTRRQSCAAGLGSRDVQLRSSLARSLYFRCLPTSFVISEHVDG